MVLSNATVLWLKTDSARNLEKLLAKPNEQLDCLSVINARGSVPTILSCLSKQMKTSYGDRAAAARGSLPLPRSLLLLTRAIHPARLPQVFGFFATIVFAIDFYLIFNDVAKFLKQEDSAHETTADKAEGGWPPCGFQQRTGIVTWDGCCGDPPLGALG